MLSDMWRGFGERNELGRGVPEEESQDYSKEEEGSTEKKWGHIKNARWRKLEETEADRKHSQDNEEEGD